MTEDQTVTVFIATTAEAKRKAQLERAIDSVLSQADCSVKLVIVINGDRYDQNIRSDIENHPQIESHYLELGSFPEALVYARRVLTTQYFCFLDDDDELLANSISSRLAPFKTNSELDIVVGNGLRKMPSTEVALHKDILAYQKDPLVALLGKNGNWLASCAGLYRANNIPVEYFQDYIKYAEWRLACF